MDLKGIIKKSMELGEEGIKNGVDISNPRFFAKAIHDIFAENFSYEEFEMFIFELDSNHDFRRDFTYGLQDMYRAVHHDDVYDILM